jgi:hypothetical protein
LQKKNLGVKKKTPQPQRLSKTPLGEITNKPLEASGKVSADDAKTALCSTKKEPYA